MEVVYENSFIYVEVEKSQIPWLKIFSTKKYKELSDCDKETKQNIFNALEIVEKEMIAYFNPEKINIASFGNYLPQVHFHIMARFVDDSYFPEPMWGTKQRETNLELDLDGFYTKIAGELAKI